MERVNNIFKKFNKKITISTGIFFLVIFAIAGLIKITLNVMYPGNDLDVLIKESIRDTFGKAVKFDSYYFRFDGDIVLLNFYLSNTSDFNDNFNLVKCDEIVIDTDILSVFRKKILISGVYIYGPEINVIKNYGKNYYDIITDNFTSGLNRERFESLAGGGFFIKIYNATGIYREIFRNGKNAIEFSDLDVSIRYSNKKLSYNADGDILKREKSLFDSCSVSFKGEVDTTDMKSESRVRISDFDIIQLEEFFKDNNFVDYIIRGDLSADIKISHENNLTRFNGESSIDNLECINKNNGTSSYICNRDDIESEFNFYISDDYSRVSASKIMLKDGIFRIDADLEYEKGSKFSADIKTNRINLDDLSDYISPFEGCDYSGYVSFQGKLLYLLDQDKPEDIAVEFTLDRFNLNKNQNRDTGSILVKNCNSSFMINKDKIQFSADFGTGMSDFKVSVDTAIKSWAPFSSSTSFKSNSENLELKLLKNGVFSFIKLIYDEAFIDMFQNFDEQRNFLKEPEGIFISNNNFNIDFSARSLLIAGNSRLSDFNISLGLVNGTLKTNNFALNGYSGTYSFDLYAAFRQEYPFIRITGALAGFDLGAVSADSGLPYSFAGILSCDYKFETNAYRIGQVIENGNASIALSVSTGFINNYYMLKKVHEHLAVNGYACDPFDSVAFDSMSLDFVQSGGEFYIKKFSLSGAGLSFNGYGRFLSEDEGLKLPVSLQAKNGVEYVRVPLILYGELLAPCIKVNEKKSEGAVCF